MAPISPTDWIGDKCQIIARKQLFMGWWFFGEHPVPSPWVEFPETETRICVILLVTPSTLLPGIKSPMTETRMCLEGKKYIANGT